MRDWRKIQCPCEVCRGVTRIDLDRVEQHLVRNGRMQLFRVWRDKEFEWDSSDDEWACRSGQRWSTVSVQEPFQSSWIGLLSPENPSPEAPNEATTVEEVDVHQMLAVDKARDDILGATSNANEDPEAEVLGGIVNGMSSFNAAETHEEELRAACKPLFQGARMNLLSFVMVLLNICYEHGVPNIAVDEILALLQRRAFPEDNHLPSNHYQAKKLISRLSLDYKIIHTCPNGCVLFRGEYSNCDLCPQCGSNRYKLVGRSQVPAKVLRHFPVIPRMKRMFRVKTIAELMRWSSENKSTDGKVRHPSDSLAWKHFEQLYPDFTLEPRNLHFGLALDGVNPFSDKSTTWSTWPVLLINYNLPPWLATKKFFLHMALLIPGKESVRSSNIDVYLQPLIEELQELWRGVPLTDVSCSPSQAFPLRAMLLWTVNDYPALGLVAGQSTKGVLSCVACGPRVVSEYSSVLHKPLFFGARRWLPLHHRFRGSRYGLGSDARETSVAPSKVSGHEVLEWAEQKLQFDAVGGHSDLLVRHIIDLMHTEKNICNNLLKTILGEKDQPAVRQDMQNRGIHSDLWLQTVPHRLPNRAPVTLKPKAPWDLSPFQREVFLARLAKLRVPTGYCGSLQKHILNGTIGHMKSHDFHVFMQQFLPVLLRGLLPQQFQTIVCRLSKIFQQLCTKVWDPITYNALQIEAAETLVLMETYLPPVFFDNMTHLILHFVEELQLCGPVHCRWMYPIERYLSKLKRYVRNKARPEGCMAKCFKQDEVVGLATEYMANF
ncbi:hypothetical protein R1sor_003372 [Riccia sorocarpa]|uniref:DUF4218 domain-containing protein n=1 Tax=Riccia sorocarpa TaxID=122646 RepID=A0ABD3H1E4_9MARC